MIVMCERVSADVRRNSVTPVSVSILHLHPWRHRGVFIVLRVYCDTFHMCDGRKMFLSFCSDYTDSLFDGSSLFCPIFLSYIYSTLCRESLKCSFQFFLPSFTTFFHAFTVCLWLQQLFQWFKG